MVNLALPWIRGVNLGSWLLLERYIVPYMFSVTDCHVAGDLCWYPGQLSAPPSYKPCDLSQCQPLKDAQGNVAYPVDEKTLAEAFLLHNSNKTKGREIAEEWFNTHFDNFMTRDDLVQIRRAGLTHVRVPLPHWMMGGDTHLKGESWIVGKRWEYFVRLCHWAREIGLQVWPDVHTAPGSQNGFDNSGEALPYMTCEVWSYNSALMNRSLASLHSITKGIADEGLQDVVTGFGLLNEPFYDCSRPNYQDFIEKGLEIVRRNLGSTTHIYVSDMFLDKSWNDGQWWTDPQKYNNTFLDSHYYQVFDETSRALSPRQHIAFTCRNQYRHATSCCYDDAPRNKRPSKGVARMVGEWSAAYDTLPSVLIGEIMQGIAKSGQAPLWNRTMPTSRKEFLRQFIQAQIVTFEAASVGTARAWFYWTAKMEGGAFAEWDFLRGVREGWFPEIVQPHVNSESVYGNCHSILLATNDSWSIIQEYPDAAHAPPNEKKPILDDDVVLTHGESWNHPALRFRHHTERFIVRHAWFFLTVAAVGGAFTLQKALVCKLFRRRRDKYTPLADHDPVRTSSTV